MADAPPPPPPPPGWQPPPRRGGGRVPAWGWALIVLAAVALVGAPLALAGVLFLRSSGGPTPTTTVPVPTTSASPTTGPDPDPSPSPTEADEGSGGLLDGLLDDLFGGMDPVALAACIGAPTGRPEELPDDEAAAIGVIGDQVARERGLTFTDPVDPVLLSPDDLRDRVVELAADDYTVEAADVDGRLLAALGAVPAGTDLRQLQLDLLGGQVAGFYDPDSGELTAVSDDGLDPTARMTMSHELDHALVDQALGLPDLGGEPGRSDAALATLAVVEGDATLLMQRWASQQLSLLEQLAAATASLAPAGDLQSAPWVLQQQLVFPYTTGLEFTCEQFVDGGWPAVDALYASPPTTTAQVLWPERYAAGEDAVDVSDPTLPDGWQEVRRDQLGAADLLWLFQAPGDDRGAALDAPADRARAWAGGELAVGTRGGDTVVAITLAEHPDAPLPLCDSMLAWYRAVVPGATTTTEGGSTVVTGDGRTARITCADARVRLLLTSSAS